MKQSKNQLANLEKGKRFSDDSAMIAATKSAKTRAMGGHTDSLETQKMLKEFEELRKNAKKHMGNGLLH